MSVQKPTICPPLFVPLTGKWFDAFERGDKRVEYRAYGPRWNERTCAYFRPAVLSRGYGRQRRLEARVVGFETVGPDADPAISEIYPGVEIIAAITFELVADRIDPHRQGYVRAQLEGAHWEPARIRKTLKSWQDKLGVAKGSASRLEAAGVVDGLTDLLLSPVCDPIAPKTQE